MTKCEAGKCRNEGKFTVAAELMGFKSDTHLCMTHLLFHLRGVSFELSKAIGKVVEGMTK